MKRILSLIIALSMLFSMTVYAEGTDDSAHELDLWGYERFVRILADIGVELPELELTAPLKRGDFLKSMGLFFGYSHLAGKDGDYSEDIKLAHTSGWITDAEKAEFKAEETILLRDAAKYIINALGYTKKPSYAQDADKSYASDAAHLGIYDGITTGWNNPISAAQMLKMFYNTMEVNVFEYKGNNSYAEGNPMLYEVHDIVVLEGIVTANYQSGMAGEACGENSVEINGVEYACSAITEGMVGKYAICYMRDDTILHVLESAKKNKTITIKGEDVLANSTLRQLVYLDENEKERDIDLEYPPSVFVNGSLKGITSIGDLIASIGIDTNNDIAANSVVEAIDNDSDGRYEVLRITKYLTYVVDKISYNTGIITDSKINETIKIDVDDYKVTVIKDGAAATFEDIKKGNVIEIAADCEEKTGSSATPTPSPSATPSPTASASPGTNQDTDNQGAAVDFSDCKFMTILVTTTSVGGVVTTTQGSDKIEIDGSEYELSDYLQRAINNGLVPRIKVGMSGAFYENHLGKLVYVNTAPNAFDKYGFLLWADYDIEYDGLIVKMFTTGEKVETLKLAEKVVVDGISKDNDDSFMNAQTNGKLFADVNGVPMIKNQLVIYRLNDKNEIRYIDTASTREEIESAGIEDPETTLRLDVELAKGLSAVPSEKSGITVTDGTIKFNNTGNVYASYTNDTGRYSNVSIKPSSETLFVVAGLSDETAYANMQVDEPLASAKNFEITTGRSKFGEEHTFVSGEYVMFYNVGDDNSFQYAVFYDPNMVASYRAPTSSSSATAFFIGCGETINSEGEATYSLRVRASGSEEETKLICKDKDVLNYITGSAYDTKYGTDASGNTVYITHEDLNKGDIIRYALSINGEVTAVKRDVDFDKMMNEKESGEPECFDGDDNTGITNGNSHYDTIIRWLGTVGDTYFTLVAPKDSWDSSITDISTAAKYPIYRTALSKTTNVLIYDVSENGSDRGTFRKGTLDDLFAAKECGDNASILYVRHTVGNPNMILAYNFISGN